MAQGWGGLVHLDVELYKENRQAKCICKVSFPSQNQVQTQLARQHNLRTLALIKLNNEHVNLFVQAYTLTYNA